MKINKNLVPKTKYSIKAPYKMKPEFVIIHNTYNDASAKNEIAYMIRNNNYTSYHYAVDDKEIIQAIPHNRSSWNAGDGSSGQGNRKGIAIEICYSKSGGARFNKAERNAAKLTAKILNDYKWGINKVKKHQDFSGKYCPHRTLDRGWNRFLKMVEKELKKVDKPKVVYPNTPFYAKVINPVLNIRDGAGIKNKKVGQLKQGDVYTITEVKNGWGKLKYNLGWISLGGKYVEKINSIELQKQVKTLKKGDVINLNGKKFKVLENTKLEEI